MRAGHESRALGLYFTNKLCLLQTVRGNGPTFLPLPTGSTANGHRLPAAAKGRTSGESTNKHRNRTAALRIHLEKGIINFKYHLGFSILVFSFS